MYIKIKMNGEERVLKRGTDIAYLLETLNLPIEGVAVVRNRDIIQRDMLGRTLLEDGDELELIRVVGGG